MSGHQVPAKKKKFEFLITELKDERSLRKDLEMTVRILTDLNQSCLRMIPEGDEKLEILNIFLPILMQIEKRFPIIVQTGTYSEIANPVLLQKLDQLEKRLHSKDNTLQQPSSSKNQMSQQPQQSLRPRSKSMIYPNETKHTVPPETSSSKNIFKHQSEASVPNNQRRSYHRKTTSPVTETVTNQIHANRFTNPYPNPLVV